MTNIRHVSAPTDADLDEAWATISARLAPTPLVASPLGTDAWLKLETMQPTGSFKVRGALAALERLPAGQRVITASAGNHGLGIAWAASLLGLDATVVVSEQASPAKVAKLRTYPIELILHGDSDAAEGYAPTLVGPGSTYVSPYNDTMVIAGQSTVGRELDTQTSGPLTVVVPVGGGGLLAGIALWAQQRGAVKLVGVEACASLAVSTAVAAGRVVPIAYGETLADGLAGNIEPGSVTPTLLGAARFVCVDEAEIRAAMRWLMVNHGIVAEGAGATAVAAVLAGGVSAGSRLVVLVTGRNVTPERYAAAIASTEA
jgi:threonine dehydratase